MTCKDKKKPWRFPNGETVSQRLARHRMNPRQLSLLMRISPQTACNWRDGNRPMMVYVPFLESALRAAK